MSSYISVQGILFPFLYCSPNELTNYTPKAINQLKKWFIDYEINRENYKECNKLKELINEIVNLWYSVWGVDTSGYPVDGAIRRTLDDILSEEIVNEICYKSMERFIGIVIQTIYMVYDLKNIHQNDVKEYLQQIIDNRIKEIKVYEGLEYE